MRKSDLQPEQYISNQFTGITDHSCFETYIERLTKELQAINDCQIGKPARYYKAYKAYSLDFGINILEHIILTCKPHQRTIAIDLRSSYYKLKRSINVFEGA